jgi:hypothetical protein
MSYAASEAEAFESEGFESEAFGEYGEAAGRRGRTPRTASGRGLAPIPQTQQSRNFVTYAALRQAMDKVGAQIKTNSDAITAVGNRLNSTAASLRKEFDERKKDTDAIRGDINQKTSMLALLPLIMTPPTYTIPANTQIGVDTVNGNAVSTGANALAIQPPPTTIANALLPLLLIGGFSSSPSGTPGGGIGGMDNTMLLIMALVLANPARA